MTYFNVSSSTAFYAFDVSFIHTLYKNNEVFTTYAFVSQISDITFPIVFEYLISCIFDKNENLIK